LIDLVSVKPSKGTFAVFKLSNVSVLSLPCAPDHLCVRTIWTCVSQSVFECANVLALIVWPYVLAFSFAQIIFKDTLEPTLIVFVLNGSFAIQTAAFVPVACEFTLPYFHVAFANELSSFRLIVRGGGSVSHG